MPAPARSCSRGACRCRSGPGSRIIKRAPLSFWVVAVRPRSIQSVSLPIAHHERAGRCGPPRKSRRGRWRAVNAGRSCYVALRRALRPLAVGRPHAEPNRAQRGDAGRWSRDWSTPASSSSRWPSSARLCWDAGFVAGGCHVVALQDLCTWLLKQARIHPRPFRSRLLVFVPLLAALYMFVWPTVRRLWLSHPTPTILAHFLTDDLWATFPGVWMALLTFLVCGFLCVLLLGNKGFCTYACPYGGFFGLADRVAPGRIRVTDACDGCGHCTAACTSNVRVHEEVRQFGMVVSPGCMKCTDCVSVCPNDALYFGFGRPSFGQGRLLKAPRSRVFDYALARRAGASAAVPGRALCVPRLVRRRPVSPGPGPQRAQRVSAPDGRAPYSTSRPLSFAVWPYGSRGGSPRPAVRLRCSPWCSWPLLRTARLVQYHAREGERLLRRAEQLQAAPCDGRGGRRCSRRARESYALAGGCGTWAWSLRPNAKPSLARSTSSWDSTTLRGPISAERWS